MFIQSDLKIAIYLISSLVSLGLMVFFLAKSRKGPLLYSYIWLQSIVLLWSVHVILLHYYHYRMFGMMGSEAFYFYVNRFLYYAGFYNACFIGLGWLVFCLVYTRFVRACQKYLIPALFLPPLILFSIVLAKKNLIPSSVYNLEGFFSMVALLEYAYCAAGFILLIRHVFKQQGHERKQSLFILLAGLIPISFRLAQDFNLFILKAGRIISEFDPTPIGFSMGMTIIAFATYRYRFLNYVPFALQKLVGNMQQAIAVFGEEEEALFSNRAFSELFRLEKEKRKITGLTDLRAAVREIFEANEELERVAGGLEGEIPANLTAEVILKQEKRKYFSVNIQPLTTTKSERFGRIITFTDVTQYRDFLNELNGKNNELTGMNQELAALNAHLEQSAHTEKELAVVRERNRFARDVHDTLGHTMTVLITLLKVSSITCETDAAGTRKTLLEAVNVAKDGLKELRRSISGLAPERLEVNSFENALCDLVKEFQASGVAVDLTVDGMEPYNDTIYSNAVFRICQEAMTNSLRHGNAKKITLVIKAADGHLKLFITDDGYGCGSIKKGFGLSGMEQRVRELEGSIRYGSDGESGFNIYADIPVDREL